MIEVGLYLMSVGMGGVFVVLSILASAMWLMGRALTSKEKPKEKTEELIEGKFTEKEIMAIAAAIFQYESEKVPSTEIIRDSDNWKKTTKIYAMRWFE